MELKCTNPNGEIVDCSNLKAKSLQRYSKCPKNKIVHNFFITNPNGMNQSFPKRQKYNLGGKNSKIQKIKFLQNYFAAPFLLFLA